MKKIALIGLAVIIGIIMATSIEGQTGKSGGTMDSQPMSRDTFIKIAKDASPAVVNVFIKGVSVLGTARTEGLGTGFIIDSKQGIILTNQHVASGSKKLAIALNDKRILDVEVLGTDLIFDVAVLKIINPPSNLKAVPTGDSNSVQPGEWVLAIGQPFGLEYTVTAGIVCALNREVRIGKTQREVLEYVRECFQIDALLNPGNSGGPLFNLRGQVIAINSAVRSGTAGGYGLSLPINVALDIKDKIIKEKRVIRAYLGIDGYDIDEALAVGKYNTSVDELLKTLGIKEAKGVFIASNAEDSPAASVGFLEGDILSEFDGKKVENLRGFRAIIAKLKPGAEVKLKYIRKGQEETTTVTLTELTLGGSDKKEEDE